MSAILPKGYKLWGVRVTLHNFKEQWPGARMNIHKRHDMEIVAKDEITAKKLAIQQCYKTETYAAIFIESVEAWEMEPKRATAS